MAPSRLASLPGSLPQIPIPEHTNPLAAASSIIPAFPDLVPDNFAPDAIWRDQFALTGTFRTFYSATNVTTAWQETNATAQLGKFALDPESPRVVRMPNDSAWVEAWYSFHAAGNPARTGTAILLLVPGEKVSGPWRIWILRTILEQLDDCPDVDTLQPVVQLQNGAPPEVNGATDKPMHFDCVIVGGGQSGLATAGRLKALGVSNVILEKNKRVGDNWALRYKSTRLHTIREYSHLPFDRTFSEEYQEYLTKDDMARGYETWVGKFDINIWLDTRLASGSWDQKQKNWNLRVCRNNLEELVTCDYMVFATGAGCSVPIVPRLENREAFHGIVLHSADYVDCSAWKGKHGIVIGTANTAHDVAEDMLEAGLASVTMVQRSRTYVLPAAYYKKLTESMYNPLVPTEYADRAFSTNPLAMSRELTNYLLNNMARTEPERFDSLERAGFRVDRFGSIMHHIFERLGGHYLDTGASAKISQGLIKVKSAPPVRYTECGLEFADGTVLKADVIVLATGFETDMRLGIGRVLGSDVAEQVGEFWALDDEGELTGECKPTGHPALWMHGGTLGTSRYYSRFIALQIKSLLLGTPLPRYDRKFTVQIDH